MTVEERAGVRREGTRAGSRRGVVRGVRTRRKPATLGLLLAVWLSQGTHVAWADERIEARRHFQAGMALIQVGRFVEGIEELEIAYHALPHPAVLFNIGRAYLDAKQPGPAIDALERYLATAPADRDEVLELIARARALEAAQKAQARPAAAPSGSASAPAFTPGRIKSKPARSAPPAAVADGQGDLRALAVELEAISTRLRRMAARQAAAGHVAEPGVEAAAPPAEAGAGQSGAEAAAPPAEADAGQPGPEPPASQAEAIVVQSGPEPASPGDAGVAPTGAERAADTGAAPESDAAAQASTESFSPTDEAMAGAAAASAPAIGRPPEAPTAVSSVPGAAGGGGNSTAVPVDPYAPVVITASRYGQDPLEAPNALTVLSAGDLRRAGVRTLPDLLRQVAGLEVMAVSPGDFNVGIRGFNATLANKVLVLVDGRSVYLDFVGANLWPLLSISLSDVERVEVIRGPGAALYGANAFSGVINIITRAPGAADDRPQVTLRAGVPDWTEADVHLTGRRGAFAYRASAGLEQVDRWSVEIDPTRTDFVIHAAYPEEATRLKRFDARVDRRLGPEASISLSGGLAAGQLEFAATGALRDFFVDGAYSYLRGDLELPHQVSVRVFWNRFDATASPWATPVGSLSLLSHPQTNIVDLEVEWFHAFHAGVDHKLNAGVGYRYKSIDWTWLGSEPREHHFSLFAQDELRFTDDLLGVLSLRLDRHPVLAAREDASFLERFPVSPRAAVVWKFAPGQAVRGTIGTAFRTPTFLENYIRQAIPTSNDAVVVLNQGDLELAPEHIVSTEVGYRSQPADSRYELDAAAFLNRVSGLVQLGPVSPWTDPATMYDPGGYWYAGTTGYINVDEDYTALGGEVGGRLFPMDGLDLYANYAYVHIQRGSGDGAERSESTSPHKFNAGFQITGRGGLSFGTSVHVVSAQVWRLRSFDDEGQVVLTDVPLPAYTLMGVRLGYVSADERLELALEGTNLLDLFRDAETGTNGVVPTPARAHREYPLGQPVPVNLSGTLTWRF